MIKYRLLPEQKLLVFCIWGVTSVEEVQKLRQEIRTSIDLSQDFDAIIEVSHLERWFTSEEIHMFSTSTSDAFLSNKRLAIIASSDIAYGVNRMFEAMSKFESPLEISVFRNASSALKWLGREEVDVERILEEMMGEEENQKDAGV